MLNIYEQQFEEWLINDTTRWNDKTSVSQYKSGINCAINWINKNKDLWKRYGKTPINDFDFYLQNINCQETRSTFFSAILNVIQKGIDKNNSDKAVLQNYKSYVGAFESFFKTIPLTGDGIKNAQLKLLRINSDTATYTQKELIDDFSGRILTQDRVSNYKTVLFPIRLIHKLWKKDAEDWAEDVCEKIWIILGDNAHPQKFFEKQIKDIKTIEITSSGDVRVEVSNGRKYILYTSYFNPYEKINVTSTDIEILDKRTKINTTPLPKNGFYIDKNLNIIDTKTNKKSYWHVKPLKAKSLGDIAIDHDVPIARILSEKAKQLESLEKLSRIYRKLAVTYSLKVSASDVNKFCTKVGKNINNELLLKNSCDGNFPLKDMNIIGKCRLVLMEASENSAKSSN